MKKKKLCIRFGLWLYWFIYLDLVPKFIGLAVASLELLAAFVAHNDGESESENEIEQKCKRKMTIKMNCMKCAPYKFCR